MTSPDVKTFGDDHNPEVSAISVDVGDVFRCPCGTDIALTNAWLAAHWDEPLQTDCKSCGQQFHLRSGRLKIAKPEKWKTT